MVGHRAATLLVAHLAAVPRTAVGPGLTTAELDGIERRFGFEFADDHRSFLATVLPIGPRWPDWRTGDEPVLRAQLSHPVDGVLLDVEHHDRWVVGWGPRPASVGDALAAARERLSAVPQLVPVHGHRYLPSGRGTAGHPVLSVHQTDVVAAGTDLVDFVHQEFRVGPGVGRDDPRRRPRVTVAFWRDLGDPFTRSLSPGVRPLAGSPD